MKNDDRYRYYSVRNPMKVNGQRRVPSVCYELPESAVKAMEALAAKGDVILYKTKVRFMSGAVVKDNPIVDDKPYIVPAASPQGDSSSASTDGEFAENKD
jgi:gamma-glutamylcyclotransferase (GGCT)/AIG2-like uncharacterized protein YtfP